MPTPRLDRLASLELRAPKYQLLSEGRVNTEVLISHQLPLSQFLEAFRITQNGKATKVISNVGMAQSPTASTAVAKSVPTI
jgi:hypothetical protein